MTTRTGDIRATWDGSRYVCDEAERWWSRDGDEWFDVDGQPACGDRFEECSILLVGGERDGEWVS